MKKNFIGIDLGTTNSAISSYDGISTHIWKSPEGNDVTPSAIYIDRRNHKYVGIRAYDRAPLDPDNAATLFKRHMGTNASVTFAAAGLKKTPEECSAEILKVLFGYLPEELRNDPEGTVITVPAAFNQMQKDATMQAAELAGIGRVALMQEPVAAVMSFMRTAAPNGIFLIYDLGGGTLDVAVAESTGKHVSLFAQGGIAMCGGRDFDRTLVDNVVRPWLMETFSLPEDFVSQPRFKTLLRLAAWASERAKIELSSFEESTIRLLETEVHMQDLKGEDIYLEIPLCREEFDRLVERQIEETIEATRRTLESTSLSVHDLESIVFIGGPTKYKPLRDKVAFELGLPANIDVNPMTAVAEGASIFAESIDWSTRDHSRKTSRGRLAMEKDFPLAFSYSSRTTGETAKLGVQLVNEAVEGLEFQVDSDDTGWTSGRIALSGEMIIDLPLSGAGENTFTVSVVDASGGTVPLKDDKIVVTRTSATVNAIPASHSIGIEVLDSSGSRRRTLEYLIRSGDPLPHRGTKTFRAGETLEAGSSGDLRFNLWEGEILDPITDNRSIGCFKISGADFTEGVIAEGAELICEYKILDSGNILLEVSAPGTGNVFISGQKYYSRQEGQDYNADPVVLGQEGMEVLGRLDTIAEVVDDPKLEQVRQKLAPATSPDLDKAEAEVVQEARERLQEAKRLLAEIREKHQKEIRSLELAEVRDFFEEHLRQDARPSEVTAFENLSRVAQRSIEKNDRDFERYLDEIKAKNFDILWRQEWFVVERFKYLSASAHLFMDKGAFNKLAANGREFLRDGDIQSLRTVVVQLSQICLMDPTEELAEVANILRG
ncbi:MAG: Hsp70 family protein [Synergistaceae bacterium]|jgi:molecular chaperone DnaK|nr:Hsp70 family protein [Synergistaceae bacterium]